MNDCGSKEIPKCTGSSTDVGAPRRAIPEGGSIKPKHPNDRNGRNNSTCKLSSADEELSACARDRSDTEGPSDAQSKANEEEPKYAMPEGSETDPSLPNNLTDLYNALRVKPPQRS